MLNVFYNGSLFADAAASGGSMLGSFGIIIIMIIFMYFFMIRPQKKRQKEIEQMRSELSVGNRVVTIGGFIGKIKKITDDEIYLILGNSKDTVVVRKWAIQGLVDKDQAKAIDSQHKNIPSDESSEEVLENSDELVDNTVEDFED